MNGIGGDIDEIRRQRNHLQDLHSLSPDMWPPPQTAFRLKHFMQSTLQGYAWLLLGMVVMASAVIVYRVTVPDQEPAQAVSKTYRKAEQRITLSPTPGMRADGDARPVFEMLPLPAAGHVVFQAGLEKKSEQATVGEASVARSMHKSAVAATTASAYQRFHDEGVFKIPASTTIGSDSTEGEQVRLHKYSRAAASAHEEGKWTINLVSFSKKADADRFTELAWSKNIRTKQQHVTVKGKQYWRVQIAGFPTAAEAKRYAITAKQALELEDVWIKTR